MQLREEIVSQDSTVEMNSPHFFAHPRMTPSLIPPCLTSLFPPSIRSVFQKTVSLLFSSPTYVHNALSVSCPVTLWHPFPEDLLLFFSLCLIGLSSFTSGPLLFENYLFVPRTTKRLDMSRVTIKITGDSPRKQA